jgi:hypothetical protein
MILFNMWRRLKATNLLAEFLIVTLSVIAALAGDKYLTHLSTLEQEEVALKLIHEDLKRNHKAIKWTIKDMEREDSVFVDLLRHAARDTVLSDSTVNAAFKDFIHFTYFDRTVANVHNYDSKVKNAGKQVIQSDSLSYMLANYYDRKLNNLTLWTDARYTTVKDMIHLITQEGGYLDHGLPYIHKIQRKSFNEVLGGMTSNIRIMAAVSDKLWYSEVHKNTLRDTAGFVSDSIKAIEAFFIINNLDYDPFDPEETW